MEVSWFRFFLILAILVLLRLKSDKLEIRLADILVAVVPVVLALLVTGQLQTLEIGEGASTMSWCKNCRQNCRSILRKPAQGYFGRPQPYLPNSLRKDLLPDDG
ncbi:hypothetical protein [Geoalkalibacter halelectricus]|uniref:hypothetical protein n=1 Tax=Geoalkalibacter halelectricus TaxID=2847045 RepID=UPI00266FD1F5|nr:hypothetical protein [Geoalkalibacter halelectricus]